MRTKEIADICGVTEECIRQNAKKVGIVLENGKAHEYTEDELKKIQVQLMRNAQNNNVNTPKIVKETSKTVLEVGLATNILANSGDIEAMREFCEVLMQKTQAQHDLLLEQQKNQLLIEQNLTLQKEVDKYVNWMSKSEIKAKYYLPRRPGIDKVALLLNLQEGKDWVKRFYNDRDIYWKILYSPEAVERIVEYIVED